MFTLFDAISSISLIDSLPCIDDLPLIFEGSRSPHLIDEVRTEAIEQTIQFGLIDRLGFISKEFTNAMSNLSRRDQIKRNARRHRDELLELRRHEDASKNRRDFIRSRRSKWEDELSSTETNKKIQELQAKIDAAQSEIGDINKNWVILSSELNKLHFCQQLRFCQFGVLKKSISGRWLTRRTQHLPLEKLPKIALTDYIRFASIVQQWRG